MDEVKAYCLKCKSKKEMIDPIRVKWRNKKSKTGSVDAWQGKCPSCNKYIYRIIGKG